MTADLRRRLIPFIVAGAVLVPASAHGGIVRRASCPGPGASCPSAGASCSVPDASDARAPATPGDGATADYAPLADLLFGSLAVQVLLVGTELGIVDLLANGPLTAREIAARVSVPAEHVPRLVTALAAIDLVEPLPDGRYAATPFALRFLRSDVEGSLLPIVKSFGAASKLTAPFIIELLRGKGPRPTGAEEPEDPAALRHEFETMHGVSWVPGQALAERIDFSTAQELLDVGGGSGAIAIRVVQAHPRMRASITELPRRTQFPEAYVARHGLADRIRVVAADMFTEPFPGAADVVLLSQIVHNWSDAQNHTLFEKSFAYLPPGGRLIVHEVLLNDSRTGPRFAAMQDMLMGLMTGSRQYSEAELRGAAARAGFEHVVTVPTAGWFSAVVFRKPAPATARRR